jgi:hypothetical protein
LADGDEVDGSGKNAGKQTNPLSKDTDGDGVSDGVELGVTTGVAPGSSSGGVPYKGTDGAFTGDADPASKTDPTDKDSDNGTVEDGAEDANGNGKVDSGETDPNNPADDVIVDKDSDDDGVLDGIDNCDLIKNSNQDDSDGDGIGDICDYNDGSDPDSASSQAMKVTGGCTATRTDNGFGGALMGALALLLLAMVRRRQASRATLTGRVGQVLVVATVVTVAQPQQVLAADGDGVVAAEQFDPVPVGSGILATYLARTPGHLKFGGGLTLHYNHAPVKLVRLLDDDTRPDGVVVPGLFAAAFSGRLGLWDWLEVGASVPFAATVGEPDVALGGRTPSQLQAIGMGDTRVVIGADLLRLMGVTSVGGDGFGLGLRLTTWLPTGNSTALTGEGAYRFEPRLTGDWRKGKYTLAANLAYQARPEYRLLNVITDDAVRWAMAAKGPIVGPLSWIANAYGTVQTAEQVDPLDATKREFNMNNNPMEGLVGLHWHSAGLDATLAGGAGLNAAVGSPAARVILQFAYVEDEEPAALRTPMAARIPTTTRTASWTWPTSARWPPKTRTSLRM